MKKILLLTGIFLVLFSFCYAGDVSVKGYTRKDGTYVAPYHRSSPDSTVRNNYNYKGNANPYTGETGDNYYRNNPTSEYYGTSSSRQTSNYNYSEDSGRSSQPSQYNSNPSYGLPVVSTSPYRNTRTNNNPYEYSTQRNSNQYGYGSSNSSSSDDSDSEE